jgi:hypothetical protein
MIAELAAGLEVVVGGLAALARPALCLAVLLLAEPADFARLGEAARGAASLVGFTDPVSIALRWLFARVSEDEDPQTAAALVIHLASGLDEETRETARRIAFGL